jgi:hypothetical protein
VILSQFKTYAIESLEVTKFVVAGTEGSTQKPEPETARSSGPVTLLNFIHYFHTVCLSDRRTHPFSRNFSISVVPKTFSPIQSILIFLNSYLNIITRIKALFVKVVVL